MPAPRNAAGVPMPPTHALDAWAARARASADGFGPYDALWRAACWEQAALDLWHFDAAEDAIRLRLQRARQELTARREAA